jgi:hypothetical protein
VDEPVGVLTLTVMCPTKYYLLTLEIDNRAGVGVAYSAYDLIGGGIEGGGDAAFDRRSTGGFSACYPDSSDSGSRRPWAH